MNEHIDDLAELYALGMLGEEERSAVDAHAATCGACSARIGQSEAVIASLVDAGAKPQAAPPELAIRLAQSARAPIGLRSVWPGVRAIAGIAAALVLALGLSLMQISRQNHDLRVALSSDERAFSMLTHSHFRHVEFSRPGPASPSAKVLYARDGSWFYVVVDGARPGLHVIAEASGSAHDYGVASVHGHTTTFFAETANRTAKIELREGATTVGVASPQY